MNLFHSSGQRATSEIDRKREIAISSLREDIWCKCLLLDI